MDSNLSFIPAAKPVIGREERVAVDAVLASGMLAQGAEVAAFEDEFSAQLVEGRHAVAVNSGTSALHLGLLAAGIGSGDEVIVPSFTFAATANSVALTGAVPVFVDIEPNYFCLDPKAVVTAVTERTKGIMPVHLYGHPANMVALKAIADDYELLLFEDSAQAHGASLNGQMTGSLGSFGAFSFYPTKNMTSGEGGMITTADARLARHARLLRNQGMDKQYENELIGYNYRMTDVHAAIGRVQLRKLLDWTKRRQANAAFFNQNLSGVITPMVADGAVHVYHQYTIRVLDDRDGFVRVLREEHNIGSGVYYPIPNHRLSSFASTEALPETERAAQQVVSLPVYPSLTDADLERIVNAVNAITTAGA
jgi:dTDP-4-amino-4,6-dideoxygalactose transaminase